jgi:hypothetical protein
VSDRTFLEAAPDQVDPAHMFMHRYAHQRERFLARKAEANVSVWEGQAEKEAEELQPTDALFGPELAKEGARRSRAAAASGSDDDDDEGEEAVEGLDTMMEVDSAPAEDEDADALEADDDSSAADEADFDEADDLDWGDMGLDDDEDGYDDLEDLDDVDDFDAAGDDPDAEGLDDVLEMSTKDKSRKAKLNDAWMDQAAHGIARKRPQQSTRGAQQRKRPQPKPRRR